MKTLPRLGVALLTVLLVSSCAKQGEGERCDRQYSGDEDCESGLVCVSASQLNGDADRCCPPQDEANSDSRCDRFADTPEDDDTTDGAGGAGGATGAGGTAGSPPSNGSTAGAAGLGVSGSSGAPAGPDTATECHYTSECAAPLVCGPTGRCQPECIDTRDCAAPLVCDPDSHACVEANEGA